MPNPPSPQDQDLKCEKGLRFEREQDKGECVVHGAGAFAVNGQFSSARAK